VFVFLFFMLLNYKKDEKNSVVNLNMVKYSRINKILLYFFMKIQEHVFIYILKFNN